MERTPFYEVEEKAGANFAEDAGWLMPANYGDAAAEYREACDAAALFDFSHHGKIEVRGPDAATFLQNLCTNDIKNVPRCEAFFCNAQARVLGHAWISAGVSAGESSYWLDVAPGTAEKLVKHLDRYLISEQVEIFDRRHDSAQFHLAGPQAPPQIEELVEGARKQSLGTPMQVWRHDLLGLPGYDVLCAGQPDEL